MHNVVRLNAPIRRHVINCNRCPRVPAPLGLASHEEQRTRIWQPGCTKLLGHTEMRRTSVKWGAIKCWIGRDVACNASVLDYLLAVPALI